MLRALSTDARRPVIWAMDRIRNTSPAAGVCCVRILDPGHARRWGSTSAPGCADRRAEWTANRDRIRARCYEQVALNDRHAVRMFDLYGPLRPGDKRPVVRSYAEWVAS